MHRRVRITRPSKISVHQLTVLTPYRLDLTVSALRRLSTNIVDTLTSSGAYARVLAGKRAPVFVHVAQSSAAMLTVTLEGDARDRTRALALVPRMLGVDRDLTPFTRAARNLPWLAPLAKLMRGVKPPRYPSLWEACVNAIIFQQVSLLAATAIMRRLLLSLATPFDREGATLYQFPSTDVFLKAPDRTCRTAGLSANKLATLRRAAESISSGVLDEKMLEALPSPDAAALLRQIKGIGPWTATVILLRGLGRLDVFPMNDTSVARNLALVAGDMPFDVATTLQTLGAQRGMLYYHLLLARLDARGDLGKPSLTTQAGCTPGTGC